jgi:hypothetical protein
VFVALSRDEQVRKVEFPEEDLLIG